MNPTFTIYRADGSKVPSLKKSFLVKQIITNKDMIDGILTLEDGTKWTLVVEQEILKSIPLQYSYSNYEVFCICSYQVHEHGNYVVARLCKDKATRDITANDCEMQASA